MGGRRFSFVVPESVPLDELGPAPTDMAAVVRDASALRNTLVKKKWSWRPYLFASSACWTLMFAFQGFAS